MAQYDVQLPSPNSNMLNFTYLVKRLQQMKFECATHAPREYATSVLQMRVCPV
jgi:hypothetical protein